MKVGLVGKENIIFSNSQLALTIIKDFWWMRNNRPTSLKSGVTSPPPSSPFPLIIVASLVVTSIQIFRAFYAFQPRNPFVLHWVTLKAFWVSFWDMLLSLLCKWHLKFNHRLSHHCVLSFWFPRELENMNTNYFKTF